MTIRSGPSHAHIFAGGGASIEDFVCTSRTVKCPPEISKNPSTGRDAVQALNNAGIQTGVLLSTGYFFGSPTLADLKLDVAAKTRAENTFVVDQAKGQCGRLIAFISVDPLSANALDEIAYWGQKGGATGLKLHLGNSHFDFRSPEEVKKLAAIFRLAAQLHFAIVVHLETPASDFGARDIHIFLTEVAPFARSVPSKSRTPGAVAAMTPILSHRSVNSRTSSSMIRRVRIISSLTWRWCRTKCPILRRLPRRWTTSRSSKP